MAKYQTLTTKKEPEVGQLINIESTSPVEHEKPEKLEKKDDTSRVEGRVEKLNFSPGQFFRSKFSLFEAKRTN